MKFRAILVVAAAVVAMSCSEPIALEGVEWQATILGGEQIKGLDSDSYTILLGEDQQLSGKGECNRIIGKYSLTDGGKLTIESRGTTMMFCPNLELEERFIKALESTTSYAVKGGKLTLYTGDKGDRPFATFTPLVR
ncbi:MAG: META domain-containing protein [Rikenellaceae bacterium]